MRIDDEILLNYRAARSSHVAGNASAAERYYRENRLLGVDLYYEVDLPEHLLFVHPIGTVLGRATYGDHLVVYQNVGVGSDVDGNRPVIGAGVVMFPGAKVLGRTTIGNNVWITANTVVQNVTVPDNSIVFPAPVTRRAEQSIVDNEGIDGYIVVSYFAVICAWRPTDRSVRQRFFPEVGGDH